jgi:hypothetical protein
MAKNRIAELEVRCPNAVCDGSSVSGSDMTNISMSSSSNSDVTPEADENPQKKRKQDHDAVPSFTPAATSCEWMGQMGDYEAHVAVCPFAEVPCPFAEAGCAFRAARRDIGAHSSDAAAHFLLLMTTVAAVKAESTVVNGKK